MGRVVAEEARLQLARWGEAGKGRIPSRHRNHGPARREKEMRRLLQRIEDGLYYQGRGTWTNNPDLAYAFNKTSGAIECYIRENLPPVQVVLKFEDSAFDIRLPCCTTTRYPREEEEEPTKEQGTTEGSSLV